MASGGKSSLPLSPCAELQGWTNADVGVGGPTRAATSDPIAHCELQCWARRTACRNEVATLMKWSNAEALAQLSSVKKALNATGDLEIDDPTRALGRENPVARDLLSGGRPLSWVGMSR